MRLAKSQAHQPFPGFFEPGFLLSNHRCKSLFQGVCPDSNRAFSCFMQMRSASALFQRRFFRLAAVFFSKKNHKDLGVVLLVLPGQWSGALFHFKKGAGCSACICTSIIGAATSTGGTCGDTSYKSTLTITNKKSTTATLSFDYSIEQNSGKIQVDGTEVSSGASFTKELAANETVKVYIQSGSTSAATKITLTNVVLVSDVNATATFMPAENGSYTVDGKLITEEYSNTQSSMTAYQVVATPADGYYVNGKVTYVGLIEIDGDFYYVRSNGEVVTDCVYWITWTHGLKEAGYYTFDENGKLTGTPKNGIVEEDGVLHYYVNGTLTYAGLIKIGDDYYYVNSKCEVVRDCDYYISWTHDLMPQGRYHFDADGKLTGSVAPLKNGIYDEDGSLYFYRNGERTYAGLIQIDGDYYYVRSTCEVVHDRSYYVYWTHGLMPEGYYNFDSAGRMILDSETE